MQYLQQRDVSCVITDNEVWFNLKKGSGVASLFFCSKCMTRLIFFAVAILIFTSVDIEAASKIDVRHIASYTAKSMGGGAPSRLYIDRQEGELYVATKSKEIIIINEDGMAVFKIPLANSPQLFSLTKDGNIYLSDEGEINILNYRGEYLRKLDLSSVPDSTLLSIQSLHIDENGYIYIGDGRSGRVIVLDSSGKFLFQFGKKGSNEGEFLNAKSIVTDSERLYLLDPALFRISVYNKKDGKFLFMFGIISSLFGGFSMPSNIDTDGERLFVVDTNRFVVIVFDKNGKPIAEFGGAGKNPENLSWPSDVKADKNGKIYVCDTGNARVQVYELVVSEEKVVQQIDKVKLPETAEPIPLPFPSSIKGEELSKGGKAAEPVKVEHVVEKVVEPQPAEKEIELIKIEKQEEDILVGVFKNLEFESGEVIIKKSSFEFLDKLYELLTKKPAYKLHIAGHTDNIGSEVNNLRLGQERTDAVKAYLTNKGIAPSRITTVSYGKSKPVADNSTEEGRKINRRVEFLIVK